MVFSEEALLQTVSVTALIASIAMLFVASSLAKSKNRNSLISGPAFHRFTKFTDYAWAGGFLFNLMEFSPAMLVNKSLIVGSILAGKTALSYLALFTFSAAIYFHARNSFKRHYSNEILQGELVEDAKAGLKGLTANDVEVLKNVKQFKGDLQRIVFETGWLEEQDVLQSLKKLRMLKMLHLRNHHVYVTPEGHDIMTLPATLFSFGMDKEYLKEMASARDALNRGEELQSTAICSRALERALKESISKTSNDEEITKIFGKSIQRLTLGDLIMFVRDKQKDHFLSGILTSINEVRKKIHDGIQVHANADQAYILTEIALKYLHTPKHAS